MAAAASKLRSRGAPVDLPVAGLGVALILSVALLLALTAPLTFLLDDWAFLTVRRGFGEAAILEPHNEHIVVGPILIYKTLLELFGMDSARPFQVVAILVFAAGAVVLFAWLRRRIDPWLALAGTVLLLFCGAAWEDLLWSFQIGMLASMACGLAMLIALERRDPAADIVAAGLLAAALCISSLGLAFAAAAAVSVALEPDRLRRAWIVAAPVGVFALWWLGWGRNAESAASLSNVVESPLYVLEGLASSIASVFGLATPPDWLGAGPLSLGLPLLAIVAVAGALRARARGGVSRGFWVVAAFALAFWFLAALNAVEAREPTTSRYQYVGVVAMLLCAAELWRGAGLDRVSGPVVAAVVALAVAGGVADLRERGEVFADTSDLIRADLGAIEIAADHVDPGLPLTADIAGTISAPVVAGPYLSAVATFGSPADTPAEIAAAPEPARVAADRVLMRALGLTFTPTRAQGGCRPLDAKAIAAGGARAELGPGGAVIAAEPGAEVAVSARRFATQGFPIEVGTLGGGDAAELAIPPDRASEPWEIEVAGTGGASVCESRASAAAG